MGQQKERAVGKGLIPIEINRHLESLRTRAYEIHKELVERDGYADPLTIKEFLLGKHRRSEIAVRKVYGATTRQIVEMLNLRYVWIVLGCFVVAAPVAWYITSRWLESFASSISQPWWLYIAALLIVLAVTVGLVTLRSWRAATENPADVVKSN